MRTGNLSLRVSFNRVLIAIVAVLALTLAACGSPAAEQPPQSANQPAPEPTTARP